MTQIFQRTFVRAQRVRSFEVTSNPGVGWLVFEREGERVLHQQQFTDWHRVERATWRLANVMEDLRQDGWREM